MDTGRRRVSIREAAKILDVSESAIHKRVQRGTLVHDKVPDGRVFVYLDGLSDSVFVNVRHPSTETLISEMRGRIGFLERELAARSDEIRRRDAILLNMTEAMRALNPRVPPEPRDGRETPAEGPDRGDCRPADKGAQETVGPRPSSWWRRLLFG